MTDVILRLLPTHRINQNSTCYEIAETVPRPFELDIGKVKSEE